MYFGEAGKMLLFWRRGKQKGGKTSSRCITGLTFDNVNSVAPSLISSFIFVFLNKEQFITLAFNVVQKENRGYKDNNLEETSFSS